MLCREAAARPNRVMRLRPADDTSKDPFPRSRSERPSEQPAPSTKAIYRRLHRLRDVPGDPCRQTQGDVPGGFAFFFRSFARVHRSRSRRQYFARTSSAHEFAIFRYNVFVLPRKIVDKLRTTINRVLFWQYNIISIRYLSVSYKYKTLFPKKKKYFRSQQFHRKNFFLFSIALIAL